MPGSNPNGQQRWRWRRGSGTRVAHAQPARTLQWGGSKLPAEGARQLPPGERSGWGGGAEGTGEWTGWGGERQRRDSRRPPPSGLSRAEKADAGRRQVVHAAGAEGLGQDDGSLGRRTPCVPGDAPSRKAAPLLHPAVSHGAPAKPLVPRLGVKREPPCSSHLQTSGPLLPSVWTVLPYGSQGLGRVGKESEWESPEVVRQ